MEDYKFKWESALNCIKALENELAEVKSKSGWQTLKDYVDVLKGEIANWERKEVERASHCSDLERELRARIKELEGHRDAEFELRKQAIERRGAAEARVKELEEKRDSLLDLALARVKELEAQVADLINAGCDLVAPQLRAGPPGGER